MTSYGNQIQAVFDSFTSLNGLRPIVLGDKRIASLDRKAELYYLDLPCPMTLCFFKESDDPLSKITTTVEIETSSIYLPTLTLNVHQKNIADNSAKVKLLLARNDIYFLINYQGLSPADESESSLI